MQNKKNMSFVQMTMFNLQMEFWILHKEQKSANFTWTWP